MLIENFRDLASHSSLHGVKFLADSRKWYQRLYWTLALFICSFIAFDLIREDWSEWNNYPVEIAEDYSPKPLSSVFIPAVTICDDTLMIKDFSSEYSEGIDTRIIELIYLCKVLEGGNNDFCEFIHSQISNSTLSEPEKSNSTMWQFEKLTFFNIYKRLMVPLYKLTLENKLFHEYGYSTSVTVGRKGLCQTVGLMSVNHVYRKTNLAKFLGEDFGDGRNISVDSDSFTGLPILMMDEDEFSYPSIFSDIKGFKLKFVYDNESNSNGSSTFGKFGSECIIAVHSPWEVPSPFIRWQPCDSLSDSNILISYKIDYTYSDSDVVDAPIADRDCLYPHERSLRYFSYYSPKNCLFECIANKTAIDCGCVTPYMPNSDGIEFCEDSQSEYCVEELLDAHFVDQFASDNICGCLPLCNAIDYTITDLEPVLSFGKQTTQKVIEFRFKDSYINPLHRYLTDTVFKFLINTMTTLDMFLGFSVLSILELIYFLIVIVMRWVDEERHDFRERQEQRKQSLVSAASWCTVCKQMEPFKITRKSIDDSIPNVHKNDPPANIDDFAFLENHEFTDNCANCRKLQSFAFNKHVIQLLKNEIKKEIGEHLVGFRNHECLSEIREMIDKLRSDIHELKRKRAVWE